MNRLYSPADFESRWSELKIRYGETAAAARALAEELDEPYDLVVIESFIGLINDYGLAKVREANKITASFRRSYGKRHFGYTQAILERWFSGEANEKFSKLKIFNVEFNLMC